MGLLDVIFLKPMVNGNQVAKALDRKSGPWTKKALEMAMEWQLRNPDVTDENACIDEVIRRRKELDSI